jgi:predicted DNA-binding transcriptional regulator AlpA
MRSNRTTGDGPTTAPDAAQPQPPAPGRQAVAPVPLSVGAAMLTPLLVPAATAALLCGRSEASWWRDHAAGRTPRPVKLGGRTLWVVSDLQSWVALRCPPRDEFEARREAGRR